jgi:poly(hydroxyalkanoate) depolymerase family esterase
MGEALSIRQMTEAMVLRQGLDRKRIFITGLSAGGAMAAAMLASYPEVFAGGAIIAGLPYGNASTIPQAFDRMLGHGGPSPKALQRILRGASNHPGPWPRVAIWQGTADQTVAPSNADAVAAQWLGVHGFDEKTPAHPETGGRRAKRVWRNVTGEAMVLRHGLDRKRIFITGLSAGGAMAAAMLASYPEVFAGGAVIAGLPYGSATTIPQAFDRMRGHGGPSGKELQRILHRASDHRGPWPRISIWHGTADQTVAPSNADAVAAQWLGVHGFDKKTATRSEADGRLAKRDWCNSAGEAMVVINRIAGMGHGTPIGDGLGAPGPFMLDAGISSTREIARFWGIDTTRAKDSAISKPKGLAHEGASSGSPSPAMEKVAAKRPAHPDDDLPKPPPEPGGIQTVIENALRAAGLMR